MSTFVSWICLSGTVRMSSDRTTKSASLPASIDPLIFSSNVRYALPVVLSRNASSRVIFWSAPSTPPLIVSRVTK